MVVLTVVCVRLTHLFRAEPGEPASAAGERTAEVSCLQELEPSWWVFLPWGWGSYSTGVTTSDPPPFVTPPPPRDPAWEGRLLVFQALRV